MWDLRRATLTRFTIEPGSDSAAVWTPDGRHIIFSSDRTGDVRNLWWQLADGTGTAERLTTSPNLQNPSGVSADGTAVVFDETPPRSPDIMRLPLTGERRAVPLLQTTFIERNGVVSPDGRWLADESNSSGRGEIFVRPFPNTATGLSQVSTAGGTRPLLQFSFRCSAGLKPRATPN